MYVLTINDRHTSYISKAQHDDLQATPVIIFYLVAFLLDSVCDCLGVVLFL